MSLMTKQDRVVTIRTWSSGTKVEHCSKEKVGQGYKADQKSSYSKEKFIFCTKQDPEGKWEGKEQDRIIKGVKWRNFEEKVTGGRENFEVKSEKKGQYHP